MVETDTERASLSRERGREERERDLLPPLTGDR
jgi:hypothetical protein